MPKRLPLKDILSVIARCLGTVARYWVQYTLVACAWLVVIPLTACKYFFETNFNFYIFLMASFYNSRIDRPNLHVPLQLLL